MTPGPRPGAHSRRGAGTSSGRWTRRWKAGRSEAPPAPWLPPSAPAGCRTRSAPGGQPTLCGAGKRTGPTLASAAGWHPGSADRGEPGSRARAQATAVSCHGHHTLCTRLRVFLGDEPSWERALWLPPRGSPGPRTQISASRRQGRGDGRGGGGVSEAFARDRGSTAVLPGPPQALATTGTAAAGGGGAHSSAGPGRLHPRAGGQVGFRYAAGGCPHPN